jgi:hypothetical protein
MEMLEWDAHTYDALPLAHEHWGATAIAHLRLSGKTRPSWTLDGAPAATRNTC